jgi:hypothetical protein
MASARNMSEPTARPDDASKGVSYVLRGRTFRGRPQRRRTHETAALEHFCLHQPLAALLDTERALAVRSGDDGLTDPAVEHANQNRHELAIEAAEALARGVRDGRQTRDDLGLDAILRRLGLKNADECLDNAVEMRGVQAALVREPVAEVDDGPGRVSLDARDRVRERVQEDRQDLVDVGLGEHVLMGEVTNGRLLGGEGLHTGVRHVTHLKVGTELADAVDERVADARVFVVDEGRDLRENQAELRLHLLSDALGDA